MTPEKFYHIYNHANGTENLFRSDENYRYFLQRYYHFIPNVADTYAYCLMPNHVHFLIKVKNELSITEFIENQTTPKKASTDSSIFSDQTPEVSNISSDQISKVSKNLGGLNPQESNKIRVEKRISQQFSNLFNSYTKSFNKMYSRKGSLFMPNFKQKEITHNSYFTKVVHYIHANPMQHGFTNSIADWPWSSFQSILLELPTQLKNKEVLKWFGNSDEYVKFHTQPIKENVLSEMGY